MTRQFHALVVIGFWGRAIESLAGDAEQSGGRPY